MGASLDHQDSTRVEALSFFVRDRDEILKHVRSARWVYVCATFGENVQITKRVALELLNRGDPPKILASVHPSRHASGKHVFLHKDTGEEI